MPASLHPGIARADDFADECHYFALALQARAGGTLAYVGRRGRDGGLAVGHVVVTLGEGVHADAEGIWREDELLAAWRADAVEPTDPDAVARDLGRKGLSAFARGRVAAADRAIAGDAAYLEGVEGALAAANAPAP